MSTRRRTILIDFDGPIHAYSMGFRDGSIYDKPALGALDSLAALNQKYRVVIFTTRLNPYPIIEDNSLTSEQYVEYFHSQLAGLRQWLDDNRFVQGIHYEGLTFRKMACDYIIDDRALTFAGWHGPNMQDLIHARTRPEGMEPLTYSYQLMKLFPECDLIREDNDLEIINQLIKSSISTDHDGDAMAYHLKFRDVHFIDLTDPETGEVKESYAVLKICKKYALPDQEGSSSSE